MFRWLVVLPLVGCFSEPPTIDEPCVDGRAGCDCTAQGTCDAELECEASIDKCVRMDCTPGSLDCTCADGQCLGALVCQGGVCSESLPQTSSDPTRADGGSTSASSSSTATTVDDSTGISSSVTITTDTLTTSVTSLDDSGTSASTTEGGVSCPECIEVASTLACEMTGTTCENDNDPPGCATLMVCILDSGASVDECCTAADKEGRFLWNALVLCAQKFECDNMCPRACT